MKGGINVVYRVTDVELLDKKIKLSGLKSSFIVQNLGISKQGYYLKKNGKTPFKTAEVYVMCDLLNINDDDEKLAVFSPES